ncbi:GGDEF domain-containing protein [Palleronia sp.]|uniref:GGDEF domain-containing protein n=1 Tax=Palleronia sp. TaxID=1940284 RepID=UPI0035C87CCD
MITLIDHLAPRSPLGWAARIVLWLLLIAAGDLLVRLALLDRGLEELGREIIVTLIGAAPFVVLALGLAVRARHLRMQLAAMAVTDILTGVSNRAGFHERAEAAATGCDDVIMMVDIDHFKQINDRHGHPVGDLCLREVARSLQSQLRHEDVIGRVGGEEFAIMLIATVPEKVRNVGERIAKGILMQVPESGVEVKITLSVGASLWSSGGSLECAIKKADDALYRAKRSGRARMVICPELDGWYSTSEPVAPVVLSPATG